VNVRNAETPLASLWAVELDSVRATRLTADSSITVSGLTISDDGKWVGFRGTSADRYERNITEQGINTDLYLLEVATGQVERLTSNQDVGEQGPSFSPDGRWVAFAGPDDLTRYNMSNTRLYLRAVADRGGQWRKLGESFDGDLGVSFWSADGKTIYFSEGIRATNQFMALDVEKNTVRQVTKEQASLFVSRDEDSGTILITYSDPRTPSTMFTVPSVERVADRRAWRQLTDVNPQVRGFLLGEETELAGRLAQLSGRGYVK
jgi:dipeptidyl aminopeptidase/acylaminoacyl peptidase